MDVRQLYGKELEKFLYEYIYLLDSYQKLQKEYNNLIMKTRNKQDLYIMRKKHEFENWKPSVPYENRDYFQNNIEPKLMKKRDKRKSQGITLVLGFILGIMIDLFLVVIRSILYPFTNQSILFKIITILLPFIFLVLFVKYTNNRSERKRKYYDSKLKRMREEAREKDYSHERPYDELRKEFKLDEKLNQINITYDNLIQEIENKFDDDTKFILNSLNYLKDSIPYNYQSDLTLLVNMYVYVNEGRADNWKEALNLYYEDMKHDQIINSIDKLNKTIKYSIYEISNKLTDIHINMNNNMNKIKDEVQNANMNINSLNESIEEVSRKMDQNE